tara:strand:- start:5332 stop:5889 length:558 start_codon:yes stop_codon:yes gene_type:complete
MKYFLFVLGACSFFFASNLNAGISYKSVEEETITFVYIAAGIEFSGKFVIKRSQFELNFVEKEKSKFFVEIDLKKSDAGFPLATSAMLGKSVLYAEKYPIMKFTSNSVKEVDNGFIINGTLNLRGISKAIIMKARPKEIYRGKEKYLTFILETNIDRFKYGADGYSLLVDKTIFLSSEIILEATE